MKDENADKPAEFDAELQVLYRVQALEVPSAELDYAIVLLAKSSSGSTKSDTVVVVDNSFWRRHRWPLSSAASVVFVATLLLINQDATQDILSDESYTPVMMQMSSTAQEPDSQTTLRQSEPRAMMKSSNFDEPRTQLNSVVHHEVAHVELSAVAAKGGAPEPVSDAVKAKIHSLSDSKSLKTMPQRDAVVSAKQALNHLDNLVKNEQWVEAEKLVLKIRKSYPQLNSEQHPQYLRWKTLSEQVIMPLPKPSVPVSDR